MNLSGSIGAEIHKVRPCLVVSEDGHNEHMSTVTVAPMSSASGRVLLCETAVPEGLIGNGRPGRVKAHQLRAVDKSRLGKKLGALPVGAMAEVDATLRIHLGL